LEDSLRSIERGVPALVTEDFNARSAAWSDLVDNQRGEELCTLFESLNLVVLNEAFTPTFPRGASSIVDVSAASESLSCRVHSWRVMDDIFNYSDRNYIRFSLNRHAAEPPRPALPHTSGGWDVSGGIDSDSFLAGLLLAEWLDQASPSVGLDADSSAEQLRVRVTAACNFSLPARRAARQGRPPVHWWNGEIGSLRS